MLITAQQLISDALLTIGAIASQGTVDETPVTSEQNDGLSALNKLIDGWSVIDADLIQLATVSIAMTGYGPYTTPRPVKIKAANCKSGQISAPVEVCSAEEWSEIVDESRSGQFCTKLFCDYAYPTSNILVWPAAAGSTLALYTYLPLTQFATLATAIDLPTGYARALTLNLAVDLAEQFGKPITQSLAASATQARTDLAATNARILGMDAPPAQPLPQSPVQQPAA